MKTKFFILIISAFLTGACSSSYHAGSVNDDLYYTPKKSSGENSANTVPAKTVVPTENKQTSRPVAKKSSEPLSDYEKYRLAVDAGLDTSSVDSLNDNVEYYADNKKDAKEWDTPDPDIEKEEYYRDGDTYVYNNYYDDFYSPYSYRIRMFHGNYWGYDPYWYSPGWSFGMSWGYPYYDYGFSYGYNYYGYYDPWYYYPGCYSYWGGHSYGHYDGYYGGYYGGGGYYGSQSRLSYRNIRSQNGPPLRSYSSRTSTSGVNTRTSVGTSGYSTRRTTTEGSRPSYTRRTYDPSSTDRSSQSLSGERRTYSPSYSKPRTYTRSGYSESSSTRSDGSGASSSTTRRYSGSSSSSGSGSGSSRTYSSSGSSGRSYSGSSSSSGSSSRTYSGGSSSGSSYSGSSSGSSYSGSSSGGSSYSGGSSSSGGSSGGSSRSSSSGSSSSGGRR